MLEVRVLTEVRVLSSWVSQPEAWVMLLAYRVNRLMSERVLRTVTVPVGSSDGLLMRFSVDTCSLVFTRSSNVELVWRITVP